MQYVGAVSNDNKEEQRFILNVLLDISIKSNSLRRDHDSDFEAEVYDELAIQPDSCHFQFVYDYNRSSFFYYFY